MSSKTMTIVIGKKKRGDVTARFCDDAVCLGERGLARTARALEVPAGARVIDEDAPHQPRGHREELRAISPPHAAHAREPQKRFVDERRRLQRMVAPFATHLPPRHAAQVAVHDRHERVERERVAVPPRAQQGRDLRRHAFRHRPGRFQFRTPVPASVFRAARM